MPDCSCVPGVSARYGSARIVTAASSTAAQHVLVSPGVSRCARPDTVTSKVGAVGTVTPSASDVIGHVAGKGCAEKK
jgi:hypothetical protein